MMEDRRSLASAQSEPRNQQRQPSSSPARMRSPLLKLWTSESFSRMKVEPAGLIKDPDPALAHGEKLPDQFIQEMNPDFVGVPLEEIDPFYYKSKTFILINKDNVIQRFSSKNSLGCFSPLSPLRLATINILNHWIIWYFLVILIVVNYGTRIVQDKINPWMSLASDILFLGVCLLELLLQCISTGLIGNSFTTLRNPWSWLDLFIVVTGLCRMFCHITLFEVISALRTLKLIPIVTPFWNSYKLVERSLLNMLDVLIYAVVVIFGLAFVGIQAYDGLMRQKCIQKREEGDTTSEINESLQNNPDRWLIAGHQHAEEYYVCGNTTRLCPADYVCLSAGSTPNYGYTVFDSFGWTCLSIVRIISQDFFEGIYFLIPSSSLVQQLLFFITIFFTGTLVIVSFVFAITSCSMKKEETESSNTSSKTKRSFVSQRTIADNNDDEIVGLLLEIHNSAKDIMNSTYVKGFLILVALINIVMLFQDNLTFIRTHPNWHVAVSWAIFCCHFVYVLEFLINFAQHGCNEYFLSLWNIYEFIMMPVIVNYFIFWFIWNEYYLLNVMRISLILLPIIKLIYRWPGLRFYFLIMWKSLRPYKNRYASIFVLTILVLLVFGEIGTILFKDDLIERHDMFPEGKMPRWNFLNHLNSLLMFFRIICGEWIRGLWDCLLVGDVYSILYFSLALFISYLLVVHMGVAIIHTTVDQLNLLEIRQAKIEQSQNGSSVLSSLKSRFGSVTQRRSERRKVGTETIQMSEPRTVDGAAANDTEAQMEENSKCSMFCQKMQNFVMIDACRWISAVIIIISCIPLGADDIYASKMVRGWRVTCTVISIVFLIYLVVEIVLKLIVIGFKKFIVTPEHWFDIFILVERFWVLISRRELSALTCLGALRPLMIIFRIRNLKKVTSSLVMEIKLTYHYFLAAALTWVAFALFGMQLLDSKFYKCIDNLGVVVHPKVVATKFQCLMKNYTWENQELSFDTISKSLLSLTAVATFNGWTKIVEYAIDTREVDEQPAVDSHQSMYIYFISFIIIGVFFLQNVLLGVLVYHFQNKKIHLELLTEEQQKVYEDENAKLDNDPLQRRVRFEPDQLPKPGPNQQLDIIQILGLLVTNVKFEILALGVIVFDAIICVLYFWLGDYTSEQNLLWKGFFWFITGIYIEELVLKATALRWGFFNKYQNILDLIALLVSILIGIIYGDLSIWGLRVMLRMLLLLYFVPFSYISPNTQRPLLLQSIAIATPAISNLVCFLALLIATFALLGMSLFKHVLGDDAPELLNFQTFPNSVLVVVQLSFLSGWQDVFGYVGRELDCDIATCGNIRTALTFILCYMGLSFLVVLNVFLVLVLEIISQMCPKKQTPRMPPASELSDNDTAEQTHSASTRTHSASTRIHSASTRTQSASTRIHKSAENIKEDNEETDEEQSRQQSYTVVDERKGEGDTGEVRTAET